MHQQPRCTYSIHTGPGGFYGSFEVFDANGAELESGRDAARHPTRQAAIDSVWALAQAAVARHSPRDRKRERGEH